MGKTSLINQAFGVDLVSAFASLKNNQRNDETPQPVAHRIPGKHNIEEEITSSHNDMFVLHDSEGFEEFHKDPYHDKINDFIESRLKQSEVKDQLHAIWYVLVPHFGCLFLTSLGGKAVLFAIRVNSFRPDSSENTGRVL